MFELAGFLFALMLMLFLGGVVIVHDSKSLANRFFFLWVIFAATWMTTNFLENVQVFPADTRELMLRMDFSSSAIGVGFLMLFVLIFSGYRMGLLRYVVAMTPAVAMAAISFTPLLLSRVFISVTGAIAYENGPLYDVYGLIVLGYVIGAAVVLGLAMRRAQDPLRQQMRIILLSFLTTSLIAIPINFFLQNVLPYEAVRIGIYSFLIFVAGTAYTIVRHEFLRVRFIVIEMFLLGLLAMLLSRLLLSTSTVDFIINLVSIITLFILGFFLIRSVLKEISQRVELETLTAQLQESNEKLKQLDAVKTEFLSIASHQLRTPLAAIRGYVDLMIEGAYGKTSTKQVEVVHKIHDTLETLIELVAQLLSVSRIESGRTVVDMTQVELQPICSSVANLLSIKAQERELLLTCESKQMPLVMADASKVKEVMMNLIENALKYTDHGSVSVFFFEEPEHVRVEIRDTGIGIDQKSIDKLFQKFSRVDTTSSGRTGTGLGLYVCKRLIEAMGGEIWVESKGLGKGSVFGFRLKKAPEAKK